MKRELEVRLIREDEITLWKSHMREYSLCYALWCEEFHRDRWMGEGVIKGAGMPLMSLP